MAIDRFAIWQTRVAGKAALIAASGRLPFCTDSKKFSECLLVAPRRSGSRLRRTLAPRISRGSILIRPPVPSTTEISSGLAAAPLIVRDTSSPLGYSIRIAARSLNLNFGLDPGQPMMSRSMFPEANQAGDNDQVRRGSRTSYTRRSRSLIPKFGHDARQSAM